jgi:6,7-dimethyl-8-ribityllumazine synthase
LAEALGDRRIVVVAASWHAPIMDGLIGGAERALEAAGVPFEVRRVPGAFELPLGTQWALADPNVAGVVALGVVIKGGTPHFKYVCRAATDGLLQVTLAAAKPVGFGVLTCDTELQAKARAGLEGSTEDKGAEAANAVVAMVAAAPPAA